MSPSSRLVMKKQRVGGRKQGGRKRKRESAPVLSSTQV